MLRKMDPQGPRGPAIHQGLERGTSMAEEVGDGSPAGQGQWQSGTNKSGACYSPWDSEAPE